MGFNYELARCKQAERNMRSAIEHPEVVRDYLARERSEGRVLGPFSLTAFPFVQVSRFGVIPKSSGKWRLIIDLSSPEGSSVNNGIAPELCSMRYASIDEAVRQRVQGPT